MKRDYGFLAKLFLAHSFMNRFDKKNPMNANIIKCSFNK